MARGTFLSAWYSVDAKNTPRSLRVSASLTQNCYGSLIACMSIEYATAKNTMLRHTAPTERALTEEEIGAYTMSRIRTWIGGVRRSPEDWHEPRNWFPAGVPEWHDKVIIGGYGRHRCRVTTDADAVMSVHVLPQASLLVARRGTLRIDGLFSDPLGLVCDSGLHNEGQVEIIGTLALRNVTSGGIHNEGLLCNRGEISTCEKVTRCAAAWGRFLNTGHRRYAG